MKQKINGFDFDLAVISTKRPDNVLKLSQKIGNATWYVNEDEVDRYKDKGAEFVVGCEKNISAARNQATMDARSKGLISVQCSDDLVSILFGGPEGFYKINFQRAVEELLRTKQQHNGNYGGCAVTGNRLNYTGIDVRLQKFVPCDLIYVAQDCPLFSVELALKEDYDICLELITGGGVVTRNDNVICTFPHRENKGGANTYRNSKTEDAVTKKMFEKWGDLIVPHRTRPGQISMNYPKLKKYASRETE